MRGSSFAYLAAFMMMVGTMLLNALWISGFLEEWNSTDTLAGFLLAIFWMLAAIYNVLEEERR